MKSLKNYFLLGLVILVCSSAVGPGKYTYTISSDYKVTIHGTSNLHSWDETVGKVSGQASVTWKSDGSFDLNGLSIRMDVHSIKSDMGSIMNNNTYKALKANNNPEIIFTLTSPIMSVQPKGNETTVLAKGDLTIAGVTREIAMQAKVFMQQNGQLMFEGAQTIKMTDYGVDPPTALFGRLKTGDEITINFKAGLQ